MPALQGAGLLVDEAPAHLAVFRQKSGCAPRCGIASWVGARLGEHLMWRLEKVVASAESGIVGFVLQQLPPRLISRKAFGRGYLFLAHAWVLVCSPSHFSSEPLPSSTARISFTRLEQPSATGLQATTRERSPVSLQGDTAGD